MINKQQLYEALLENGTLFLQSRPRFAKTAYTKTQLAEFELKAREYLEQRAPQPGFKHFNDYFISGGRSAYEAFYFERRGRLLVFSVLAFETEHEEYIGALCEAVWDMLCEYTWCLPAHMLSAADEDINPRDYACHLDLFSCETAFALSEALALCGGLLPERLVIMAKHEIERRVLTPFERGDVLYRFEAMQNNWSAVCGGALGGAALYNIADAQRLCSVLYRCLSCIDVYVSSFGSDGVCTEGVAYWNYGFAFYTAFSELLKAKTNGKIDLLSTIAAQKIACSGSGFYLGGKSTISFSDGDESGSYRVGLCAYLLKNVPGFKMPPESAAANTLEDTCYRYCSAVRDFYYTAEGSGAQSGSSVSWFESAQWLTVKNNGAVLAAKAGNNNESHNHNDCGSFIFVKNNTPLITDLGAGLYDKGYFGPERYTYLVNRSRSHNVALINGAEQQAGSAFASQCVSADSSGLSCELAGCYADKSLLSYKRKISMQNGEAVLQDSFELTSAGEITEVFCSKAPVKLNGGEALFTHNNQSASLSFDSEVFTADTVSEKYFNHQGKEETAYFLHIKNKALSKEICFKAVIK